MPRAFVTWAVASVLAGGLVFALALVLGGGAPQAPPPGIAGPGRVPAWIGDFAGWGSLTVGVLAIGFGVLATDRVGSPLAGRAAALAAAWVAVSVLELGLMAWERQGDAGLFDSPVASALVVRIIVVTVAAAGWSVGRDAPGRGLALPCALAGLLPVTLVGHPRTAEHPWLAGAAVSVHMLAAAAWVGGLAALAWLAATGGAWRAVLPRYSAIAFVSVIALTASGLVAALGRLAPDELLTSRYGAIVALKMVALGGLAAAGWLQRRYVVRRVTGAGALVTVATIELTTMAIVMGLAAALSRTPPPG